MVFGFDKKTKAQNAREKKIYRETLATERLKNAPRIAKARAKIEADAEIKKYRESSSKGSGFFAGLAKFQDIAATVTGNVEKSGGLGVYGPGSDPFSPSSGKKGKKSDDPWSF
jgi:hypothetical protein